MKKNMWRKIAILISGMICFSSFSLYGKDLTGFGSLSQSLISPYNGGSFTNKEIIQNFCTELSAFHDWQLGGTGSSSGFSVRYSPTQSAFLYQLCSSLDIPFSEDETFSEYMLDKIYSRLKLASYDGNENVCDPTGKLMNCDIALYASKIFSAVLSDYFKIKQADILGVPSEKIFSTQSLDQLTMNFMKKYFMIDRNICKEAPKFPQTCTLIQKNFKSLVKSLKTLKVINNNAVAEQKCEVLENGSYDFLSCGLHPGQSKPEAEFVNLVYNELIMYRLFTEYTSYLLQQKMNITSAQSDKQALFEQILNLRSEYQMANDALQESFSVLQDIGQTYPLHIGLIMYQEELLRFRNTYAAKIVTPFYTLYDKFRNVQVAD